MIKSIIGFINGTVTEEKQTVNTIYLSNCTHWNKNKFHRNRSLISGLINHLVDENCKELQSIISKRTGERKVKFENRMFVEYALEIESRIKAGDKPTNALRYIIISIGDEEKNSFVFAHEATSHSSLEEFIVKKYKNEHVNVLGGGFYCLKDSNALGVKELPTLTFFGASDSYGMPADENFEKALDELKVNSKNIVKFERIPNERDWSLATEARNKK